jgi:hypothetical protein
LWWWVHTYVFWTLEEAGGLWIQGLYGLNNQFEVWLGDIYHVFKKKQKWNEIWQENKIKCRSYKKQNCILKINLV